MVYYLLRNMDSLYQVSKFKDKAELKEYLMDRLDVDTSGNGAAKPIIMENDELMN